jgi:hypothetical protein
VVGAGVVLVGVLVCEPLPPLVGVGVGVVVVGVDEGVVAVGVAEAGTDVFAGVVAAV